MAVVSDERRVVRDGLTRLGYAMIGVWAFYLYFLGPVTPIIAQQLGISDAAAGATGLMLAAGLIVCGFVSPSIVAAIGRRNSGLTAAGLMAAGIAVLVLAPGFAGVLVGVGVCSFAGALLMNTATAAISARQGPATPTALTEANAIASWIGLLSPLLIGAAVAAGPGWQYAAGAVGVSALVLFGTIWRTWHGLETDSAADPTETPASGPSRLLPGFGWSLAAIVAAVGSEISLNFWGGVLLHEHTGVELATTTASMSALLAGMAVCRTGGARLTHRLPVGPLVLVSIAVATLGFAVVWLASALWLGIVGLFVTGLGLALLYPLTVGLALDHAVGDEDRAAAIIAVVMGTTMGAAPFALGAVSGALGVSWAFLLVPALLLVGAIAVTRAAAPTTTDAEDPTRPQ